MYSKKNSNFYNIYNKLILNKQNIDNNDENKADSNINDFTYDKNDNIGNNIKNIHNVTLNKKTKSKKI